MFDDVFIMLKKSKDATEKDGVIYILCCVFLYLYIF